MVDTINVIEADLSNTVHLNDILIALESYKTCKMGDSTPYTEGEKSRLKTQFIVHPNVMAFLIYSEGKIAGCSVCFKSFSTFTTGNVLNIHDLCIIEEFRGKGLGRKLMEFITRKARSILCSRITLEVREDNGIAKDLYKKFGFEDTSPMMHFWTKKL
ncbi:MAG: GNAT family N-acetyltransferase [Spirochaetaceae bacterium]|jgi:ribosomal protein S18 acetylase RimI-like enzyme|nr:GNAT family N-acetyltransferase [Spirochaetaceae bacterium]